MVSVVSYHYPNYTHVCMCICIYTSVIAANPLTCQGMAHILTIDHPHEHKSLSISTAKFLTH